MAIARGATPAAMARRAAERREWRTFWRLLCVWLALLGVIAWRMNDLQSKRGERLRGWEAAEGTQDARATRETAEGTLEARAPREAGEGTHHASATKTQERKP
jgi:hypothetical protein